MKMQRDVKITIRMIDGRATVESSEAVTGGEQVLALASLFKSTYQSMEKCDAVHPSMRAMLPHLGLLLESTIMVQNKREEGANG